MNIKRVVILIISIFCIFSFSLSTEVFAYWVNSVTTFEYPFLIENGEKMADGKRVIGSGAVFESFSFTNKKDVSSLLTSLRNQYCKVFQEWAKENYTNKSLISTVKRSTDKAGTKGVEELYLTATDFEKFFDDPDFYIYPIYITFDVDGTHYGFMSYNKNIEMSLPHNSTDENGNPVVVWETEVVDKCDVRGYMSDPDIAAHNSISEANIEEYEVHWDIYKATEAFLQKAGMAVRVGLIAGSVGSGYNVGTVYSLNQIPLTDVMEKTSSGGYDFKNIGAMKATFDYYINPILGRCDFLQSSLGKVPASIEDWEKYVQERLAGGDFINAPYITIDPKFLEFDSSLSEDMINSEGYKKTDKLTFNNGVRRVQNVGTSENPKSVISYNMRITYPHVFIKFGETYSLSMANLRLDPSYTYCIYNDLIYPIGTGLTENVTDRAEVGLTRQQIFLYHQKLNGNYVGVVLIGAFDEGVIDTTKNGNGEIYLTGRKIGFNNGYSDSIKLLGENSKLLYAQGESGLESYQLRNISFLSSDPNEVAILEDNRDAMAETVNRNEDIIQRIPTADMDSTSFLQEVDEMDEHKKIESNPDFIKVYITLHNVTVNSNASTTPEDGSGGKWSFVVMRNNRYVEDSSLINWLRTDTAQGLTYVQADKLIALITGDFTDSIAPLTYDEWKSIENIRAELEYNKDMWLIRVMNIMSIVFGVFLIIFAVLICLFYWVDIFNTFTDFSFLYAISFGNLYSVEDKENIPYVGEKGEKTHYVTFKDVLLIAFLMCAAGIVFLNVNLVVSVIIYIYNYIMNLLGG